MRAAEQALMDKFCLSVTTVSNIEEFFHLISNDKSFVCDYIAIDIEKLYGNENVNVFAMLDTINTLISCSVIHGENNSLGHRQAKMIIMISSDTQHELIKEVVSLPMISYVGLRCNSGFTDQEVGESLAAILADNKTLPLFVQNILSRRRPKTKTKSAITLTPRQRQIFNLVASRGASNKIIAKILNISESTVKLHMGALLKKYQVRNRTQLAVFAKDNLSTLIQ
jgi:DNA-binding NarL/FixJ family response regulator